MKQEFVEDKEYSHKVDELRLNRVKTSFYKYGPAKINFGDKLVNALESHDLCIEKYKRICRKALIAQMSITYNK